MPRINVNLAVFFAAALLGAAVNTSCQDDRVGDFKPASMRVEPSVIDFGPVPIEFADVKEDELKVHNDGDRTLSLKPLAIEGAG
jgi:hypothetical protein